MKAVRGQAKSRPVSAESTRFKSTTIIETWCSECSRPEDRQMTLRGPDQALFANSALHVALAPEPTRYAQVGVPDSYERLLVH